MSKNERILQSTQPLTPKTTGSRTRRDGHGWAFAAKPKLRSGEREIRAQPLASFCKVEEAATLPSPL